MRQTLCFTVARLKQLRLRFCKHSTKAIQQSQHPEKPKRGGSRPFWASLSRLVPLFFCEINDPSRLERIDRAAPGSRPLGRYSGPEVLVLYRKRAPASGTHEHGVLEVCFEEIVYRLLEPRLWGLWWRIVFRQFLTYTGIPASNSSSNSPQKVCRCERKNLLTGLGFWPPRGTNH